MLAFLISALATGFVVVFALPFVRAQLDVIPGFASVASNRLVQLLVVGTIVLLGIALFGSLARKIRI